ncbi:MAG: leucine-rich repeat domain-containing protein, partial [Eubacterium sp.]
MDQGLAQPTPDASVPVITLKGDETLAALAAMKEDSRLRISSDTDTNPIREVTEGDYTFSEYADHSWSITGYNGAGGEITLPTKVENKAVYVVGNKIFSKYDKSKITGITVPEGIGIVGGRLLDSLTALKKLALPQSLTYIGELRNLGLENLDGLAKANQLLDLSILDMPMLNDVSGVGNLTNLTSLTISNCLKVSDVSAVGKLTQLKRLNISGGSSYSSSNSKPPTISDLSDISALKTLVNLERLSINNNSIVDISALGAMKNLKTLDIAYNAQLSNIKPLAGFEDLDTLNVNNTKVMDLFPLSKISTLKVLSLENCGITSIDALKDLTDLISLNLKGNSGLKDISVLK